MSTLSPAVFMSAAGGDGPIAGAGRRKVTAKALRKMLKKAGLKTTGKKAALTRRAKKAHLKMRGGGGVCMVNGTADNNIAEKDCTGDGKVWKPSSEVGLSNTAGTRRRRRNGLVQGVYRGTTGLAKGSLRQVGRLGRAVFGRGGKVGGEDDM